jgi:hypothetical protein
MFRFSRLLRFSKIPAGWNVPTTLTITARIDGSPLDVPNEQFFPSFSHFEGTAFG